jgi:hypothetical protein
MSVRVKSRLGYDDSGHPVCFTGEVGWKDFYHRLYGERSFIVWHGEHNYKSLPEASDPTRTSVPVSRIPTEERIGQVFWRCVYQDWRFNTDKPDWKTLP